MESVEKIKKHSMCISNQCYYCGDTAALTNITITFCFFSLLSINCRYNQNTYL